MLKKTLYRISFLHQDSIYELYAQSVKDSDLFGFIELEGLAFGEQTALVVDPSEERLKAEFAGVERTLVPMQSVFRIDVVTQPGVAKVKEKGNYDNKVSHFPGKGKTKE